MNKKSLFLKLFLIVAVISSAFVLSSCFTSLRIWSCKKSCTESCNSSSDNISGNEYGIYYTLYEDGQSYMVSEVGYNETSVIIPETYGGLPVEGIRNGAFTHYRHGSGCSGTYPVEMHLSSLTLPKTIKWIGEDVFANAADYYRCPGPYYTEGATCKKLIFEGTVEDWCNISFGSSPFNGRTEFYIDGELLTDLVIPEDVTVIRENAFAHYCGLNSVTLHENITAIESCAFLGSNLKQIEFPCTNLTIGERAFYFSQLEEVTFTGEKVALQRAVFEYCPALKTVEWNQVEITHIPAYAFYNCYNMQSFVIPAAVEDIGEGAFAGCFNLIEVYNLSKLNVVAGSGTHGGVASYAGIVHTAEGDNDYILTVGDYKFVVSDEKTTLFKYTGEGGALNLPVLENGENYTVKANTFFEDYRILSVNIPDCVTAIEDDAFGRCRNLKIVSGCAGLLSIGDWAFLSCDSLESIALVNVEEIGSFAFGCCQSLKALTLPQSLKKLGLNAFREGMELTFAGALEEWQQVELSENASATVKVICSDGEVWEGKI